MVDGKGAPKPSRRAGGPCRTAVAPSPGGRASSGDGWASLATGTGLPRRSDAAPADGADPAVGLARRGSASGGRGLATGRATASLRAGGAARGPPLAPTRGATGGPSAAPGPQRLSPLLHEGRADAELPGERFRAAARPLRVLQRRVDLLPLARVPRRRRPPCTRPLGHGNLRCVCPDKTHVNDGTARCIAKTKERAKGGARPPRPRCCRSVASQEGEAGRGSHGLAKRWPRRIAGVKGRAASRPGGSSSRTGATTPRPGCARRARGPRTRRGPPRRRGR